MWIAGLLEASDTLRFVKMLVGFQGKVAEFDFITCLVAVARTILGEFGIE